jgi:hypothetical protein
MRKLRIDDEFIGICREIVAEGLTEGEWAQRESCDWFQTTRYVGGFDGDDCSFCFSYYDEDGEEWWFSISLAEALAVASGHHPDVYLRPPDV